MVPKAIQQILYDCSFMSGLEHIEWGATAEAELPLDQNLPPIMLRKKEITRRTVRILRVSGIKK